MADRRTVVEICLTSNDLILGVRNAAHPFASYRAAHVPLTLASDDAGVSRIDLTHEYQRAADSYDLRYTDPRCAGASSTRTNAPRSSGNWRPTSRHSSDSRTQCSSRHMAWSVPGTAQLFVFSEFVQSNMYQIDPPSGAILNTIALSGGIADDAINSATTDPTDTRVLGIMTSRSGSPATDSLVSVDPATGAITTIAVLPGDMDALALDLAVVASKAAPLLSPLMGSGRVFFGSPAA